MPQKQLKIKIFGDVQGVNFRYETLSEAQKLGLTGWVKNEADDTVGILAQGEEEKLKIFLNWCQKGPDYAKVEKIESELEKPTETYERFEIITN